MRLVYVTAPDQETAVRIGQIAVEQQLAACANVLGQMTSIYRWEGKVNKDPEVALILKTRPDLVERLTETIVATHPYDTPCVVALPIEGGHPAFLNWITNETTQAD